MYSHPYHAMTFFKNSTLLCLVDVTVNCFTFHHVLQLPLANADLYWALGCCFVCGLHGHCSEACPSAQGELWLICDLLEDPFGEYSLNCCLFLLLMSFICLAHDLGPPLSVPSFHKVSCRGWSPVPSDGPCWMSEGNKELAWQEEQLHRDKAAEWEMNILLEKWGFVKEDGVVNWCLESPCPLSPLPELREDSPVPSLISESPSDSLVCHKDLIKDLQIRSMAMATLEEAISLLKEVGMFKANEREVMIDSMIAARDGCMTKEWMDKFRDLFM